MCYNFEIYYQIPVKRQDESYLDNVIRIAKLSEKYNFTGALIYYDHHTIDPWIIATAAIQHTNKFIPIIAALPYSFPPFTTAKMVQSLSALYGRKVNLNLITWLEKKS